MNFDKIIIGAGFSGIVMADRLARINSEKVLVIEQRDHIGGNCYDLYDNDGILIHRYGPHIFHTDNEAVWDYLSQFTEWYFYEHRVLGRIDGQEVPIPFNLNALFSLFPHGLASRIEQKLVTDYGFSNRISLLSIKQSSDDDLKYLSDFLYSKVFLNYTLKNWGIRPEDLTDEIYDRVPIVISKDDRYFTDRYQGSPKYGYTSLFSRMLDHPNIKILLNTNMREVIDVDLKTGELKFMGRKFNGKLIYTGMIDELFNFKLGKLPYRSLRFEFENLIKDKHQNAAVVNYPNNYDFTRITEFKHLTGQVHPHTTILREYPYQHDSDQSVPSYPVFSPDSQKLFQKYKQMIEGFANIIPLGRLAEFRYYDMDDIVAKALDLFNSKLKKS